MNQRPERQQPHSANGWPPERIKMSVKTRSALRSIVSWQFVSSRSHGLMVMLALICCLATAHPALSQDWPARPVTIIVPFPPGGNTDSMARILAQKLGEKFDRNFVVENRAGASGSIAHARRLHAGVRRLPTDFGPTPDREGQLRPEAGFFLYQHIWRRPLRLCHQFQCPRQIRDRVRRLCEGQAGRG